MPSRGECCGCREAPVLRYRFNVVVEHAKGQRRLTQLLCASCFYGLIGKLTNRQVERTPQRELDDLTAGVPLPDDDSDSCPAV